MKENKRRDEKSEIRVQKKKRRNKKSEIRVLLGTYWPENIEIHVAPPGKTGLTLDVRVGNPWPEDDKIINRKKEVVLVGFAGVAMLQQIVLTAYGFFFSEDIIKVILGYMKYSSVALLIWSIGPKVGSKVFSLLKAILKM